MKTVSKSSVNSGDADEETANLEAIVRNEPSGGKRELRLWLRLLSTSNLVSRSDTPQPARPFRRHAAALRPDGAIVSRAEGLRLSELSKRMMVSNGNLTGLVERLTQEGLVLRETDPDDRRAFIVRLSKDGMEKFASLRRKRTSASSSRCSSPSIATPSKRSWTISEKLKSSARRNVPEGPSSVSNRRQNPFRDQLGEQLAEHVLRVHAIAEARLSQLDRTDERRRRRAR